MAAPPSRRPPRRLVRGPARGLEARRPERARRPARRRGGPLALAAALCLLPVTACGGVSLAGDSGTTFETMGFSMGDALATVRMDDARKALKGLRVRITEGAFDEQQFLSAVAAGDPPDVVTMDRTLVGGYAARGALLPLTDCLKKENIDLKQYRSAAVREGSLDGEVYALPESWDNRVVMMNRKVLADSGYRPSDVDTSDWKGLETTAVKLAERQGGKLTRIGFDPKIPEFFPLWAHAGGGSLLSADGRTARLDSPEVVEALEYAVGLVDKQGGWGRFKALRDSFDQFGAQNQFAKDQVGAYPMEDWYAGVLATTSPDIDLSTEFFKDRQGRTANYVSGYGWAIPKGSRHVKEACTFIETMTSADTWVHAAEVKAKQARADDKPYTGDFTGNIEADRRIRTEVWKPTGDADFDEATRKLYAAQKDAFSVPSNAAGAEFEKAWQNAVNRALSGDESPQKSLERAQDQAQTALDLANQGR